MRPYLSVCLVLFSLALAQEEPEVSGPHDKITNTTFTSLMILKVSSRKKKPAKGACKQSGPKLTDKNTKVRFFGKSFKNIFYSQGIHQAIP